MITFCNYHRHSMYTNVRISDSAVTNRDYAIRAKELGHKILSSVEHGWQGNYFDVIKLAKEYGLKPVIGAEVYWVKDRTEKDRNNCHMCIIAKNENGRQALNDILSEANITGFYGQPRVDIPLILSLPKDDVNLSEHLSKEQYRQLLDIAAKLGCSYFTFNIPNTVCNKCGHISKHYLDRCEQCGSDDIDYITRIIGYAKRISKYSEERQREAAKRYYGKL